MIIRKTNLTQAEWVSESEMIRDGRKMEIKISVPCMIVLLPRLDLSYKGIDNFPLKYTCTVENTLWWSIFLKLKIHPVFFIHDQNLPSSISTTENGSNSIFYFESMQLLVLRNFHRCWSYVIFKQLECIEILLHYVRASSPTTHKHTHISNRFIFVNVEKAYYKWNVSENFILLFTFLTIANDNNRTNVSIWIYWMWCDVREEVWQRRIAKCNK